MRQAFPSHIPYFALERSNYLQISGRYLVLFFSDLHVQEQGGGLTSLHGWDVQGNEPPF